MNKHKMIKKIIQKLIQSMYLVMEISSYSGHMKKMTIITQNVRLFMMGKLFRKRQHLISQVIRVSLT